MAPRRQGWINWKVSAAREIVLEDLDPGGWLHDEDETPAKDIFEIYLKNHEEFAEVPFEQFQARLIDYRKDKKARRVRTQQE